MSLSVEEMNKQLPVANALPGEAIPYYMASGEGARYEINGQLVTVIARAADTGGIFSAAYISGGMGAESPFVSHTVEHKTLYVFDGILHVWLPGESRILSPIFDAQGSVVAALSIVVPDGSTPPNVLAPAVRDGSRVSVRQPHSGAQDKGRFPQPRPPLRNSGRPADQRLNTRNGKEGR